MARTVVCADCGRRRDVEDVFIVSPPPAEAHWAGDMFFECRACWERMVGLAALGAIR